MSENLAARVHALIAQWRATSAETREHHDMSKWQSRVLLPKHSERTIATLRRCADELEAALDAALAAATPLEHEQQAERILQLEAALSEAKVEHTRAILRYTAKGYAAGENADSKAWRQRAEAAEAALAAALAPKSEQAPPDGVYDAFGHHATCNMWVENDESFSLDKSRPCSCAAAALAPNAEKE